MISLEKILVAHKLNRLYKRELKRQELEVISVANNVERLLIKKEPLTFTLEFTQERNLTPALNVD